MKLFKSRSIWADNKLWIITAVGAAAVITAGFLGRHMVANALKGARSESPDTSPENGSRLKSALRWSSVTGAAAGVGRLLSRADDPANTKISTNEPLPEPVTVRRKK